MASAAGVADCLMETPQVNRKQIDDLRAWFFAKDRSISLAQSCLYYLFAGGQANGAYMSMAFIAETVLSASAASITFSNIPQNFRHLMLYSQLRGDAASEAINSSLRFNGDSGANYDYQIAQAQAATPTSSGARAQAQILTGVSEGANSRGNNFSPIITFLPGYSISGIEKWSLILGATFGNVSADADLNLIISSGRRRNPDVISSLTVLLASGNIVANSRCSLYGVL